MRGDRSVIFDIIEAIVLILLAVAAIEYCVTVVAVSVFLLAQWLLEA